MNFKTKVKLCVKISVMDIWSAENATLKNSSRLTTLKRNGDNKKREQQKECLRDKIRQLSSALNMNTHTKLPIDQQIEVSFANNQDKAISDQKLGPSRM